MKLLIVIAICLSSVHFSSGMTKTQLKNAGKMMKNVCMPKNNVTPDQVQNINKGEFLEDKNVKCYIACVLQMAQTMKNGKLNYEAAKKQIDIMFPEDMKAAAKKSLEECKHVSDKHKDICEASYQTAKCMYNSNPENFVFP